MAVKTFSLLISHVDGPVFDGKAVSVTVPGVLGEMTLLRGHEPLISPLKNGLITVRTEEGTTTHEIDRGTIECSQDQITILL